MIRKISTKRKAFTLAEALITLVIIGVIAALTIPAILVNTEQHEYKSALKKALSALNQVIELNIALEGYGPLEAGYMDNPTLEDSLFEMFRNRMNVISTSDSYNRGGTANYTFFTADGMRYEFPKEPNKMKGGTFSTTNGKCARPDGNVQDDLGVTYNLPCLVIVDVNGQRRPNPLKDGRGGGTSYKVPGTGGRSKILDVFPIIITDINAYPFGVVGQRAMFQHD
ncbi:MAG: type II secretion system protein [Candidatus Gastranaerophilales bacterium]|nr:type II secretion system protein [Candidatus Gastranaerophilales bacterium]